MTAGLHPTSGKEEALATRLARAYLWTSLFLAIPVGRSRDVLGLGSVLLGGKADARTLQIDDLTAGTMRAGVVQEAR